MAEDGGVELVGSDDCFGNVVDFKTRGRWEPPEPPEPSPRERIVAREIDEDSIRHLKKLLKSFEEGENHGLAMMAGIFDEKGNLVNYRMILSEVACAYPLSFTGAIEQMKLEVADCAVGIKEEGSWADPDEYEDDEDLLSDD